MGAGNGQRRDGKDGKDRSGAGLLQFLRRAAERLRRLLSPVSESEIRRAMDDRERLTAEEQEKARSVARDIQRRIRPEA